MKQKTAVTNAVKSVLPNYVLGGEQVLTDVITADQKKEVKAILFEGFKAEEIDFSEDAKAKFLVDDVKLKKYIDGLTNNWFKKNTEFNNGQAHTPNPELVGTRSGSKDPQIKALRGLKKAGGLSAEEVGEIDAAIKDRLAQIKPASVVEINTEDLPEQFRHLVK